MSKVKWGVLGAAKIARTKVVPAMQRSAVSEVAAIASRDLDTARRTADELGIAKAYGSYEELLADPEIEAVYNPLPNHLHVPWSIKAAESGKHVLCEKPIALSVAECRQLIDVRDRTGVRIGEAFMVRTHPQWLRAREIVRSGVLGELRAISAAFSYFNNDPANVRNVVDWGGGALMDIGCYPIQFSRFAIDTEPTRVFGTVDRDPSFQTDRTTSAILDFAGVHSTFTCSTQMAPHQKVQVFGTKARLELEIPFNAPPDRPCKLFVDTGSDLFGGGRQEESFAVCDQYTIQGDLFSRAVRGEGEVPTPLEDALGNMKVIEAIFESARQGTWVSVSR